MKVLMIFDLPVPPAFDIDYRAKIESDDPDWQTEHDVFLALQKLGHEVRFLGLNHELDPLIQEVRISKPDVVFNLCESFENDRVYEPHIVALLELLQVPYTGAPSSALALCKDKGLTKKVLSYHRIRNPEFLISQGAHPLRTFPRMRYPAIVKPLGLEASEGIDQNSIVTNAKEAKAQVARLHHRFETDVIIEQYIQGREIYFGVLGNGRMVILPPRELFFDRIKNEEEKFATYQLKWDEKYRKRWGIRNDDAEAIDAKALRLVHTQIRKIYRLFGLQGYARFDFRLTENNQWYFLEANPNPALAADDDFASAARKAGFSYDELIDHILRSAVNPKSQRK